MKSTMFKTKAGRKTVTKTRSLSDVLRAGRRVSPYAFMASAGIWLPRAADAATVVNLDATSAANYPPGPITTWTNTGTTLGDFTNVTATLPIATNINGIECIYFDGAGGAGGASLAGPPPPTTLNGNHARTIEAWIFDPARVNLGTKVLIGWGQRGANARNQVLAHGTASFGGVEQWGQPFDMPYGGVNDVKTNAWTYIAYTYAPNASGGVCSLYVDGALSFSQNGLLNTAVTNMFDTNVPPALVPFRVARQTAGNLAAGASGADVGPFYAARFRIKDTAMTASDISTQYTTEKVDFKGADSDSNGLPDWWEIKYFGSIGQNPSADPDTDGLTNLQEYQRGTNPTLADTDGDGLNDGAEVNTYGTDPTNPDTDGDGVSDGQEITDGTNPLNPDSDGDGYSDGLEKAKGTNPLSAASHPDPLIALDSAGLALGPLQTWTNTGTWVDANGSNNFTRVQATNAPVVTNFDGVRAIRFSAIGTGTNSCTYFGPRVPSQITAAGARTVEMWVVTQNEVDEHTIVAWGSRAYANGAGLANFSFGEASNLGYGAIAYWGEAGENGWGNKQIYNRWTHLVATYDGSRLRYYRDGTLVNDYAVALNTAATSTADILPYHFRLGRQNNGTTSGELTGGATGIDGTGAGEHYMGKVRIFDFAADAATVQAHYNADKAAFGLVDTDGDGLPDWWENRYGLNPNSSAGADGATGDPDADTLNNTFEYNYNLSMRRPNTLNPKAADTDNDGVTDQNELNRVGGFYGPVGPAPTDPLNPDTDGDGLKDGVENDTGTFADVNHTGTSPLKFDSDGDGFSDGTEVAQGSNPNDFNSRPNPAPVVNLIATNLPPGPLIAWTNSGQYSNYFILETTNGAGNVATVQGVTGLTLAGLTSYISTNAAGAQQLTGNPFYSIEAWVYNPTIEDEECIIGWGRRGGPDGSMSAFTDGSDAGNFGAMTHWGAPDLTWLGGNARTPARWKYLAFTYNPTTLRESVFTDGGTGGTNAVQSNTKVIGFPLAIVDSLDGGVTHIPFRVGDETVATAGGNGPATAALPGFSFTGTLGEVRVYSRELSVAEMTTNVIRGANAYGILPDIDNLPIWWKRVYGLPVGTDVANQDPDGDGLTNMQEYQNGTNPLLADTDGDGLSDGYEVANFSNPLNADTDIDGLPDGRGVALGLDPRFRDTDGDGFDDATEVLYGTDPNNSNAPFPDLTTPRPFVNVDATTKPLGPLAVWTNNNALGWSFKAPAGNVPNVQIVAGTAAVMFNGTNYYTGLGEPYSFATNASRTMEAWVYSPGTPPGEQTVLAWSRRGGNPDGSNSGLVYGRDTVFGAGQFWGPTFDVPWGTNAAQIASNTPVATWSHIAVTYDNTTSNVVVYLNGNVANTKTQPGPLSTWLYDPTDLLNTGTNAPNPLGRSLPFRIGCQNDAAGNPSVPFAGNSGGLAIARAKAYNVALSAAQIAADYNAERAAFPGVPVITNVAATAGGAIRFDWTVNPGPGRSYRIETNEPARLADPAGWGTLASGLTSGPYTNSAPGSAAKLYRLRVD